MVRNFREGPQWVQAVVVERCGPVSYLVQTLNGNVWKRHIDHVKIDSDDSAAEVAKEKEDRDLASPEIFPEENEQTCAPSNTSTGNTGQSSLLPPTSQTVRRSSRPRRPPDRLTF